MHRFTISETSLMKPVSVPDSESGAGRNGVTSFGNVWRKAPQIDAGSVVLS